MTSQPNKTKKKLNAIDYFILVAVVLCIAGAALRTFIGSEGNSLSGAVTMEAADVGANIHADDVALFQHPLTGNAVDDLVVDADACRSGKSAISKKGRLRSAFFNVSANEGVKLFRAYSLADVLTGDEQSLARDASCLYHSGNLIRIFQLNHAYASNFESAFITAAVVSATSSRPSTQMRSPFAA